jgi:hypothetical protein
VVPVYIQRSFEALPSDKVWPRFTSITIIFGECCDARELAREGEGEQAYERIVIALQKKVAMLNQLRRGT